MSMLNERELRALRAAAGLSSLDVVAAVRVTGEDCFDAIDELVTGNLFIQEGQMVHTLVLDETGKPLSDLYVCSDDEDIILLGEGLSGRELIAFARDHLDSGFDVSYQNLREDHELLSLNGPWAWEVLAEWLGPDVIGIPYLSFFHLLDSDVGEGIEYEGEPGICFRAGKTGEYGYDLLLRSEIATALRERILEVGARFDLDEVSQAALDHCSLENGFFCIRGADLEGLTPLELQLQWRLSNEKEFVGHHAVAERRGEQRYRVTMFTAHGEVTSGSPIFWEAVEIGRVWKVGYSPLRKDWVGQALIERSLAYPGIDAFTAGEGPDALEIQTRSAPIVNNLSLYVDPRRHTYRFRDEVFTPRV